MHQIVEVDGVEFADRIHAFNAMDSYFDEALKEHHLADGHWWMVIDDQDNHVAFAGMVPFEPFPRVAYLKRCYVLPDHRGHDLQVRLMCVRELKAREIGFSHLISECLESNTVSITNHRRAGFDRFEPERPWAKNTAYWMKVLA